MLILVGIAVVGAGGWWAWLESTDIDEPVDVTAPPIGDTADTTPEAANRSGTIFELTDGSTVTFQLNEELNGTPKTVLAMNSEVAAQLSVDLTDLSNTDIGTVVVSAQTFETDSNNRNRAIRGPILDSNEFPTIEFVPTGIEGLAGEVAIGEMFEFTVTGDLTIRDVTQTVSFDVSASMPDESNVEGTGETTVSREDFGIGIPSVPSVANVSDEVLLTIDFAAAAVG